MTLIAAVPPPRLDIGWVLRATLSVLWRKAGVIVVIAVPFLFAPNALVALPTYNPPLLRVLAGLPYNLVLLRLFAGLPGLVFSGAVSLLTYRALCDGPRLTGVEAVGQGLRRFGTLCGLGLLTGLAFIVGLLLLVVPGLFLMVAWMPATTAAMAEDKSVFDALNRAWTLTRNSRWRLALLLLIGIAALVLLFLLHAVLAEIGWSIAGSAAGLLIDEVVLTPLFDVANVSIATVGAAAAYAGLRLARDGAGEGDFTEVFE